MSARDRGLLLLLVLLALGSRRRPSSGPRDPRGTGIPEGPPTEDNWIPHQPVLPPNPLQKP